MEIININDWTKASPFPKTEKMERVDRSMKWDPPTFYRKTMADRSFYLSVKGPWGVYYVTIVTKTNTGRAVTRELWICTSPIELHITWLHPYEQGAYSISNWRNAPRFGGALDAASYIDFEHNHIVNNSPYWVGASWTFETGGDFPEEVALNMAPGARHTFVEHEATISKLKLQTATIQNNRLF